MNMTDEAELRAEHMAELRTVLADHERLCKALSTALAERDEARRELIHAQKQWEGCIGRGVEREQELARLREALCRVKLLALTAGGEGGMEIHAALSRTVRIVLDAGITERLSELRAILTGATPNAE